MKLAAYAMRVMISIRRERSTGYAMLAASCSWLLIITSAHGCSDDDAVPSAASTDASTGAAGKNTTEPPLAPEPPRDGALAQSDPLLVLTAYGPVRGSEMGAERVFRGVPYAAPPIGALRFARARAPVPWTEPPPGAPCSRASRGVEGRKCGV
jgi:hypothetical protein